MRTERWKVLVVAVWRTLTSATWVTRYLPLRNCFRSYILGQSTI